ncbi:hypothetical protein JCM10213_004993 [Rhodosporidiobolus nylandii]
MGDTFRGGQVPVHSPDIEKTVLINPLPLFSRVHVAPFLLAYPLAYDAFYHAYDTFTRSFGRPLPFAGGEATRGGDSDACRGLTASLRPQNEPFLFCIGSFGGHALSFLTRAASRVPSAARTSCSLRKHNLAGSNVNLLKSLPHGLLPPVFPSRRSDMQ